MKVICALLALAASMAGAEAPAAAGTDAARDLAAANRSATQAAVEKQRAATALGMAEAMQTQRLSIARQMRLPDTHVNSRFLLPALLPAPAPSASYNPPPCPPMAADQVDALLQDAARKEEISPDLLRAVIHQESGFHPCAVSPKGAMGLMQLMPATVMQFGVSDPFDPRQNIDSGARLLKQLLGRYGGNVELALGAYNAGPARVDATGGVPPIEETLRYVQTIIGSLPPY
jgi:soluble lytic murein transglycosylase-like protein